MFRLLSIALLILAGCAASPDELYDIAIKCNQDTPEKGACNEEWDAYTVAMLAEAKREEASCPAGRIYQCDHWSCQGWSPELERCVERIPLDYQ